MTKKIGFIGGGNMGSAIIGGILNSGMAQANNVMVSDIDETKLQYLDDVFHVNISRSNHEVAKFADILFLAVKPNLYGDVIVDIREHISKDTVIVSVAAGVSIADMEYYFESGTVKIIRTMPNTPALVNQGITAVCLGENVTRVDAEPVIEMLQGIGEIEIIHEDLFHAFIGVGGSSPAYGYMLIDAMADAAVKHGMSKEQALRISALAIKGAADMYLATGTHPVKLKDRVCSPSGTTIEAVITLEEKGYRNAIISAVNKCVAKSMKMERREDYHG